MISLAKLIRPNVLQSLSILRNCSTTVKGYDYEAINVESPANYVMSVKMNRPEKKNAINRKMWFELGDVFARLSDDPDCRSIILSGNNDIFTAGIDLTDLVGMGQIAMGDEDVARKAFQLKTIISKFQECFTEVEKCRKPVICAISGPCVGAGVDLICGTDIRYATQDAWFQVKEVAVGLAADVGTLQRLPKIIGSRSLVSDLCLTARKMYSSESLSSGLVSRVFPDNAAMMSAAVNTAADIAAMSPVAVQCTKLALLHARDHSVQESLDFIAYMNMTMLQSEDLISSAMNMMQKSKEKPTFNKL